jgi:hypothetical protein
MIALPGAALASGPALARGATLPVTAVMLTESGGLDTPFACTTSVGVYEPATSGVKVGRAEFGLVSDAVLFAGLLLNVH